MTQAQALITWPPRSCVSRRGGLGQRQGPSTVGNIKDVLWGQLPQSGAVRARSTPPISEKARASGVAIGGHPLALRLLVDARAVHRRHAAMGRTGADTNLAVAADRWTRAEANPPVPRDRVRGYLPREGPPRRDGSRARKYA